MFTPFLSCLRFSLLAVFVAVPVAAAFDGNEERYAAVERISVEEARSKVRAGQAFLVCAYDDKRCEGLLLEGALTRREFEQKLAFLPKEQEIIIYCS